MPLPYGPTARCFGYSIVPHFGVRMLAQSSAILTELTVVVYFKALQEGITMAGEGRAVRASTSCRLTRVLWCTTAKRFTRGDVLAKIPRETTKNQGHHRRSAARR
jgi:hypothetical protein